MAAFTYSISTNNFSSHPYSTIPDKPFIIRAGKRVLPVYADITIQYYNISTDVKVTTIDWKFIGTKATILPPGVWSKLHQKRRCKAIFIPLDKPSEDKERIIGFVAASVDIQAISIASGLPIPKKKKKNKVYTAYIASPTNVTVTQAPTHINTAHTTSGYIVFSTDTMAKPVKTRLTFSSTSSPGKHHETTVYKDGSVSCNCPSWTKRVPRVCKHIVSNDTIDAIQK